MKSNYKRLGPYIKEVNVRNTGNFVKKLLGVSNEKFFIPSIANIHGTDLSKYKVIKENQFAFGPVTSRNGDKISIALLDEEIAIVSTSYITFEIVNHDELLPEYLMLWFKRDEFDRYARYKSHGSVREIFDWEQMCNVLLPIPDVKIQKKIVDKYNEIVYFHNKHIQLNELIDKIGLIYTESLNDENSDIANLGSLVNVITGKKNASIAKKNGKYAFFTCSKEVFYTDKYSFDGKAVLIAGNGAFDVKYYDGKFEAYQRTYVLIPDDKRYVGLMYFYIKNKLNVLTRGNRGSVIDFIVKSMIEDFEIRIPDVKNGNKILALFNILSKYNDLIFKINNLIKKLNDVYISNIELFGVGKYV